MVLKRVVTMNLRAILLSLLTWNLWTKLLIRCVKFVIYKGGNPHFYDNMVWKSTLKGKHIKLIHLPLEHIKRKMSTFYNEGTNKLAIIKCPIWNCHAWGMFFLASISGGSSWLLRSHFHDTLVLSPTISILNFWVFWTLR